MHCTSSLFLSSKDCRPVNHVRVLTPIDRGCDLYLAVLVGMKRNKPILNDENLNYTCKTDNNRGTFYWASGLRGGGVPVARVPPFHIVPAARHGPRSPGTTSSLSTRNICRSELAWSNRTYCVHTSHQRCTSTGLRPQSHANTISQPGGFRPRV